MKLRPLFLGLRSCLLARNLRSPTGNRLTQESGHFKNDHTETLWEFCPLNENSLPRFAWQISDSIVLSKKSIFLYLLLRTAGTRRLPATWPTKGGVPPMVVMPAIPMMTAVAVPPSMMRAMMSTPPPPGGNCTSTTPRLPCSTWLKRTSTS